MSDLRLAFRSLRATPIVSAVAILSLALGIGANTAIFSLVDSLVLRALPVRQPERLVLLSGVPVQPAPGTAAPAGAPASFFSYPVWEELRRRADLSDGFAAYNYSRLDVSSTAQTELSEGVWAN